MWQLRISTLLHTIDSDIDAQERDGIEDLPLSLYSDGSLISIGLEVAVPVVGAFSSTGPADLRKRLRIGIS